MATALAAVALGDALHTAQGQLQALWRDPATLRTLLWGLALLIQLAAIPGTLLPVLPGLALLPLGAGLWLWVVGWSAGWPAFALACGLLLLGWLADALALLLGPARLQASRWAAVGAGLGLLAGLFGLLPALPVGGPLLGALIGPLLGASLAELLAGKPPLRALQVGLAVVAGMLVSRVAQLLLALLGVAGFLWLSRLGA
jgi:uncharacterized protein YqgC (DUF456 family)